jgi:hypothetical protein
MKHKTLLDIHVLIMPGEDVSRTITNLEQFDFIKVHVIEGVKGNIGQARAVGFSKGNAPFVSYVDPDDDVYAYNLATVINRLSVNKQLSGICTAEFCNNRVVKKSHPYYPKDREVLKAWSAVRFAHHLNVFRREAVELYYARLSTWSNWPEMALISAMCLEGHELAFFSTPCYHWKLRENSAHRSIPVPAEVKAIISEAWSSKR